jgi:transcriptional regulator with XRE-family HTH domain
LEALDWRGFPAGRSFGVWDRVMDQLTLEIGRVLRRARQARGLTLRELEQRSGGRFKSTSVAGYERAERRITVERFCELATFYEVSPARLLAHALREAEGSPPVVIDLTQAEKIGGQEGRLLAEFVREVSHLRGDRGAEEITLRTGDLEVLATMTGLEPRSFVERIRSALRSAASP